MSGEQPEKPHLAEITAAVEAAIHRLDERDQAVEAHEKEKAARKEHLANRVSVAALALTMLMSFLGFVREDRDDAADDQRHAAEDAVRDIEANWSLYQARTTERAGYVVAEDALTREVQAMTDSDPRLRLAGLNHIEYATRIAQLDNESRRVFFVIQALEREHILAVRRAEHLEDQVTRYDMGTRVLTLALVILSVVLLADQEHLFWFAIVIAFAGAGLAVSGYFMR